MRDTAHNPTTVGVIGAGMVGVSVGLELQRRGFQVTLYDRRTPGRETSYGNAGVLARSSLMPLNNPGLWRNLPKLAGNRQTGFRYTPSGLMRNAGWVRDFLLSARPRQTDATVDALNGLIQLSQPLHRALLRFSGNLDLLSELGWVFLYREAAGLSGAAHLRRYLEMKQIDHQVLVSGEVTEELPALNPIFERALWIKDSASVRDPGKVVEGYARLFAQAGGRIETREVGPPEFRDDAWYVTGETSQSFDMLVICAGPWSRVLLERMGYRVPMAMERGYHMHYSNGAGANSKLDRPVYDTAGGYVLSPMDQGLRLSTGVELTQLDAPANHIQLDLAEANARQAIQLGDRLEEVPWMGARPTLPDSRPAIGALPDAKGLFAAFGHQHIGFSTGPGTGALLAAIMMGEDTPLDPTPFNPARFIRRMARA